MLALRTGDPCIQKKILLGNIISLYFQTYIKLTLFQPAMSEETLLPFEKIKREILIKRKAKSDPKFGEDPLNRPMPKLLDYGIININKPSGPTSHQVSSYVQGILGIEKSGHSGTLDPKVTGVLPVAIGKATRIVQALLPSGKEYVCIMHVHQPMDPENIKTVMKKFVGKIKQLPPIKSAVKRQERFRKIYYIDVMEIIEQDVLFRVGCQAGTYIRKLCHDMGKELGCGAHMASLIRTKAGPFKDTEMWTLQDLADAFHYYQQEKNETFLRKIIQPVESAVRHLAHVWILDSAIDSLTHGVNLKLPGVVQLESEIQVDDDVAILSLKGELVALGKAQMTSQQMMKEEKGLAIKVEKVFMQPGVYPKMEG